MTDPIDRDATKHVYVDREGGEYEWAENGTLKPLPTSPVRRGGWFSPDYINERFGPLAPKSLLAALAAADENLHGALGMVKKLTARLAAAEAERDAALKVVDAAKAYAGARYTAAAGMVGDRLVAAVDTFTEATRG